jgi:hypothetical protein
MLKATLRATTRALRSWPAWSAFAAAAWSLTYGVLGVYWSDGGANYPFAKVDDDHSTASLLEGVPAHVVAPVIAAVGFLGAAVAVVMMFRRSKALEVFAVVLAVVLALLIPDYTLLAMIALSPALLVFAFTGVPGQQDGIGDILYWHRVNLLLMFVGGLLWAATALAHRRRARDLCLSCGRGDAPERAWRTPEGALRWGRWAVLVAVLSNVPYEVTRIAWYFGWPLGITDEFQQMMTDTPYMLEVALAMAVMGIGGSILTHGLVHRWGEVYPRWIWFKAGQRIPPALAIVPASLVAVVLIPAGLMNIRLQGDNDWGLVLPGTLWVVWGAALGAAAYAYYLRRRTTCRRCGRGSPAAAVLTSRSGARVGRSSGSPGGSPRAGSPARAPRRSRTRSARSARAGTRPAAAPPTSG